MSLLGISAVMAQVAAPTQQPESPSRLLSIEEGRSIVNAAWELDKPARGTQDCSHLVHQVYLNAGFKYPYASSFEIYAGNENFARVKFPHAGDLIVWPGHVGIVVDSLQHNFYSLVSTGLEAQDYQSPYWRSRGRPRFYRYKVESGAILSAAKTPAPPRLASGPKTRGSAAVIEEQTSEENSSSNRPPKKVSERTAEIYGPPAPPAPIEEAAAFEIPSSIIIAQGNKLPTREEIAEGIFELSDAVGNVLRSDDPLKIQLPVVIVEQFKVERVEFKRDHGWARLQIDSKVVIGGGTARLKRQRERVRWELRRTESGWEAVTPVDRNYVPHDVAVKHLAAQLARLAASDDAAAHQEAVMQQESHLANLLSMLLESN
ncbi:MAG TPA: CHAP domain-containing protein [Candidatus Acidoferrum sp.]|nr:CHAP domain-containing protein [Candidatus Acidoferrum sp.]